MLQRVIWNRLDLSRLTGMYQQKKNTDTVLSSYESKEGNFILQFTSNDTTGAIPTLTGSHLFIIEHFMVGNNSDSAIERAYSTKGKLIAWRFKQWWDKTWTAWEKFVTALITPE